MQFLVVGETRRAFCVVKRSCCIVDGVVVVVAVEERRFARAIKVGAGADASGGRTAELLKVAASGRGVVTSSAAWTWSSARDSGARLKVVSRCRCGLLYTQTKLSLFLPPLWACTGCTTPQMKPFAPTPTTFGLHSILEMYKETSSG